MPYITDANGNPNVFKLKSNDNGFWLRGGWARPGDGWPPGVVVVFRFRPSATLRTSKPEPKTPQHFGFFSRILKR